MSETKILEALSNEVLSSAALAEATGLSKATVLQHLKPLIASNRVEVTGTGRATVYSLPSVYGGPSFAQESMALLESLQRPETARSPVGYKTAFLTGYSDTKPFLDRKTREHLRAVGQRGTPRELKRGRSSTNS